MPIQERIVPLKNSITPELKASSDGGLTTSENNRSVWGFAINSVLKNAKGKIGEFRFRDVSLDINGKDILIAQGIWTKEEAEGVKGRVVNNKPDIKDYFNNGEEDESFIFTSNTKVIKYLIKKQLFQKGTNSNGEEKYRLIHFPILGHNDKYPINIDIYPSKSYKKDCILVKMHIFSEAKKA
ncbi:MAG: hypothetical protein ABIJ05_00300 [Patescibacteria group bacterium]